jgi:tetratricopeptide (TPR) repeat protein
VNIFQKIVAIPMVSKHWINALNTSFEGEYQKALIHLDYLDQFLKEKDVEYHLLRSTVNYSLDNYSKAVESARTAIEILKNTDRYNEDERRYLLGYAISLGKLALKVCKTTKDSSAFPQINIASINLTNVRRHLKKTHPLINHPDWDLLSI